ncbi:MAG: hypothetical protein ACOY3K_07125 [Candidatus Omnitrophota bacterium]
MAPVYRLTFRLAVFSLPIVLVLAFPAYVMGRAGEFTSTRKVMELQEKNERPYMICPAYNDPWGYIKYKSAQHRGADILALGSSRVMMLRQTFFRVPFYNGARGVSEMKHFRIFLEALPEKARPKILLMGLDPNFFNPGWVWSSSFPIYYEPPRYKEWLLVLGKRWKDVYWDLARGAFELGMLRRQTPGIERIGLIAKAKNNGFLNDGSYLYQDFFDARKTEIHAPADESFKEDLENVRMGRDVYVPASEISESSLAELERFLAQARRMKVHVIGYVPPYAPAVYKALRLKGQDDAFLGRLEPVLKPLFKKYGFSFFDFKNPEILSGVDEEFHDGEHDGGEVSARIVKAMAQKDSLLKKLMAPAMPPSDFVPGLGVLASQETSSERPLYG